VDCDVGEPGGEATLAPVALLDGEVVVVLGARIDGQRRLCFDGAGRVAYLLLARPGGAAVLFFEMPLVGGEEAPAPVRARSMSRGCGTAGR